VLLKGPVLSLNRGQQDQFLREIHSRKKRTPFFLPHIWGNSLKAVNSFPVMAPILVPLLGVIFYGGVSPSKKDLVPPLERERNSVQKQVLSY
jgi:hypothetical protein